MDDLTPLYYALEKIESLTEKAYEKDFVSIVNLFLVLFQKIPLITVRVDVDGLVRARQNFNDEVFSEEWQISYNIRNRDIIGWGRFNRPHEPMFYGALPVENNTSNFVVTGCIETCKEILDSNSIEPYHDLTVGLWQVKSNFMVINLCIDDRHMNNNPRIKEGTHWMMNHYGKVYSKEAFRLIIRCWEFFSVLSSLKTKNQSNYYVSTAMFCALRAQYEHIEIKPVNVWGLIYPSAMTEQQGLSTVLIPSAVDRFLRLDEAVMYRSKKNDRGFSSSNMFPYSDRVKVIDQRFTFTKFDESENDF